MSGPNDAAIPGAGGAGGDGDVGGVELPDEAWVVALASLEQMGPARLAALLDQSTPAEAWILAVSGSVLDAPSRRLLNAMGSKAGAVAHQWSVAAGGIDPAAAWAAHREAGIGVAIRTSAAYPTAFRDDVEPPSVVFSVGEPDALVGPRVAVVGTRDCTRYGYDVASRLSGELTRAGVSVVSGLALGIDGAAHAGALDAGGAPPIAVVGSGLDRVYPTRNASLWRRVAQAGVVLSEYPLGTPPIGWHFPARNRLIAALADVVVVVESAETGGSLHTVDEALRRGVPVMAVPGPVTSPASAGTNALLAECAGVARDATDVLVQLGLSDGARREPSERREAPKVGDQAVLAAFDWQPATLDHLALRTGRDLADLTVALDRLRAGGWVEQRGGWFERIAKPGG